MVALVMHAIAAWNEMERDKRKWRANDEAEQRIIAAFRQAGVDIAPHQFWEAMGKADVICFDTKDPERELSSNQGRPCPVLL